MAKFAGSVELKFHQPLKEGQYKSDAITCARSNRSGWMKAVCSLVPAWM